VSDLERAREKRAKALEMAAEHEVRGLACTALLALDGAPVDRQATALVVALLAIVDREKADREAMIEAFAKAARTIPEIELVRE
jgi:hypothetical protein